MFMPKSFLSISPWTVYGYVNDIHVDDRVTSQYIFLTHQIVQSFIVYMVIYWSDYTSVSIHDGIRSDVAKYIYN